MSESPSPAPVADTSVRSARDSDVPAVGEVQAQVWRSAYHEVLPAEVVEQFTGPAFARAWRSSLQQPPSPRHRLLVACAGPVVVGFVAVAPSTDQDAEEHTGEIIAIGVRPDARRQGHGSRLVNAAADTLRELGTEQLVVWTLAQDEGTRAFLQEAGLSPDGAFRDRVVDPEGGTVREVRLRAYLTW
ncbi:MAG TPA: GNAT family N-acetyltransferase [Segeticoccus sp.]|uniref:GNAT family N-acetyltransferase n=1 Tax=Segeticoccus sp. TaxID=2706531 RepID=UPI002D7EEC24|nr:GNAT family N-acetyltransferase [Segeticoccus sp.]HET8601370.1 GNAT family N-acetyltransferase [Segeticoccus sp.]